MCASGARASPRRRQRPWPCSGSSSARRARRWRRCRPSILANSCCVTVCCGGVLSRQRPTELRGCSEAGFFSPLDQYKSIWEIPVLAPCNFRSGWLHNQAKIFARRCWLVSYRTLADYFHKAQLLPGAGWIAASRVFSRHAQATWPPPGPSLARRAPRTCETGPEVAETREPHRRPPRRRRDAKPAQSRRRLESHTDAPRAP